MTSLQILNKNKQTTNKRVSLFDCIRIPYYSLMTSCHPNVLRFLFVSQGAGHYVPRFCGDFVIARYRLESSSSASKYLAALLTSDTVIEVVRQRYPSVGHSVRHTYSRTNRFRKYISDGDSRQRIGHLGWFFLAFALKTSTIGGVLYTLLKGRANSGCYPPLLSIPI